MFVASNCRLCSTCTCKFQLAHQIFGSASLSLWQLLCGVSFSSSLRYAASPPLVCCCCGGCCCCMQPFSEGHQPSNSHPTVTWPGLWAKIRIFSYFMYLLTLVFAFPVVCPHTLLRTLSATANCCVLKASTASERSVVLGKALRCGSCFCEREVPAGLCACAFGSDRVVILPNTSFSCVYLPVHVILGGRDHGRRQEVYPTAVHSCVQ